MNSPPSPIIRKNYYLCFFVCCLLFTLKSFSQSYNFKNYSAEQGLPFVQVYAIFQDSKGNLWSGGYGGLSKFDGKTFTNYSPKNGLANHWVTSIAEDNQGNIWVGTISGLSKFDPSSSLRAGATSFSTFTRKHGLAGDYINSLSTDKNGNLWIATTEGITIYDGKSFSSLTTKKGLPSNNISLIYADKSGNIWMGTDSGVSKIAFENKIPQDKSFDNYSVVKGIYDSLITSITEDESGNIWFGTNSGVVKYDGVNLKTFTTQDGLSDNHINSVIKDEHSNDIWVGTFNGLNKISLLSSGVSPSPSERVGVRRDEVSVETFHIADVQNGDKIGKLFVDEEGNLWLGTFNGLYRFRDPAFATYASKDGLLNPMIFPIFRDRKNNLWIGAYEEGFYKYDGRNFRNYSEKDGLIGTQMNAGMEDKAGNIWMGTNKGVSIYDGKTFKNIHGRKDGLKSDSVTSIIQDRKGRIWLGGNKGGTILEKGKLKKFDLKSDAQNFDVWYEFEDSKGNIWLGTYLGGLYCYNGNEYLDFSKKIDLKSKSYLAIDEDKNGNLYFGSFDGVYIYNPSTEEVSLVSEKDGLSSDLVYVMSFDTAYENLYIGTNQGVNRFDAKEFKKSGKIILQNYGTEEGFSSMETNSNGIWRDKDGTIWFGTVNGLIHFDPYALHHNHIESRTSIKNISIFYNDTVLPDNSKLPYYLNNISFEYIGICLTNPEKVRYKFMLEGFDKTWSPETKETFAHYSSLAAGNYIFKVISCNNEGLWNKEPATFSFTILAPIWKTWWFRITMTAITALLVFVFLRVRMESVRRKAAEKLSREIQLANNELKALRAQMNPHFIFNSLSSIQSFIMTKDEESALRYLNKFSKLMRMILSNSEKPSIAISEEIDSLKLYMELEALRWDNKFDYTINIDQKVETDFHKIPGMLIQPYVENAIIHGVIPKENGKGKIEISVSQNDTYIICIIQDNGIGRKKSQALRISSKGNEHESMGMKITSERLEVLNRIHHSDLSVRITDLEDENRNALGTKVEIFIPIT
ncbi:MAG: histidine kinase [Bacteroidetes bacterium]|nr:histidine kinase [Bacteroidota bacterium]